ncbi:endo-1,4-beta-xylanase [Colletotrichum tofieldiae]|uniref:Beta-xylanase n=1 Tax=Colletotrichum tofieldiae TaxID=708197 RepID=A0A166YYE0_9PEZI|nr:endo-1,4-beta-xylanase [Colletotrichum tofieldiae]GKT57550.1 endo-1,4-beta-xylanase [Colletotrichum tofieldiae]GKT77117.1 endo-1,4-beta-xylanase [Colletotrichum tofieldiae]GKT86497.1 endo-1,4-beta-xylanase [Colletotrichum tofieldiae]
MRFSAATVAGLLALADHTSAAGLHELAVKAGKKYFGTATDNGELSDAAYTAITKDASNFGQVTPGNGQKWDYIQANQGIFTYGYADVVPDFAKRNGQILRCHTLLYRAQTPKWVTGGKWTKAQMTSIITAHINNVVGHYKGECYAWDVANEAIDDQGNYRQDTTFYNVLGLDYLTLAFNTAHAADPAAKLYYNDYNIENVNAKQQKTLELVKFVQDAGAPIHGVGMQGHFIVGSMPSQEDLEAAASQYTALGVEVAYTEFDVKFTSLPYTAAGLQSQADAYVAVIKACLNVEGCVGWTIWDWTDKYSWVPGTFPGQGGACLWDNNFKPKPAYYSVSSALAAAATMAASSSALPATTTTAAVTSLASSAVISTSTSAAEASKSSSSTAAAATTATKAASSEAVESSTKTAPITFSSVSTQALNTTALPPSATALPANTTALPPHATVLHPNATALYPNGTATLTRPAGAVTTLTGGVVPSISGGIIDTIATPVISRLSTVTLPSDAETVSLTRTAVANHTPSGNGGDAASPTHSAGTGGNGAVTAVPSYTTSTIYATNIYTITSCAANVPECPGRIGSVTTEITVITTTVPCVPTVSVSVAPTAAAVISSGRPWSNDTITSSAGPKASTLSSVTLGTDAMPAPSKTPIALGGSAGCKKRRRRVKKHAIVVPRDA